MRHGEFELLCGDAVFPENSLRVEIFLLCRLTDVLIVFGNGCGQLVVVEHIGHEVLRNDVVRAFPFACHGGEKHQ